MINSQIQKTINVHRKPGGYRNPTRKKSQKNNDLELKDVGHILTR